MCLGVPGLVIERQEPADGLATGLVEFAGVRRRVCLECVPEAVPGDYVIVHAGIAISRVDPDEARKVFEYLRESGEDDGWGGGRERHEIRR
jgi:hydrogenase expression/formation protein HypC